MAPAMIVRENDRIHGRVDEHLDRFEYNRADYWLDVHVGIARGGHAVPRSGPLELDHIRAAGVLRITVGGAVFVSELAGPPAA